MLNLLRKLMNRSALTCVAITLGTGGYIVLENGETGFVSYAYAQESLSPTTGGDDNGGGYGYTTTGTVICRYNNQTLSDSECAKYPDKVGAKPSGSACTVPSCGGGSSSSGGDSDDSDDDNESGVDVDGDGNGDYPDEWSASQDGWDYKDMDHVGNQDGSPKDNDDNGGGSSSSSSSSSSGGDSVLCTYFYQKGILQENLYYADLENARNAIHPVMMRGYHAWSISYVRYLRKHPNGIMEKLIRPVVVHRAQEVAYQLGLRDKPDYIGKLIRMTFEPSCFIVGLFAEERNWRDLYTARDFKAFADGFRRYKAFKAERAALAI